MIRRAPRLPRGPLGGARTQLPTQGKAHDEFGSSFCGWFKLKHGYSWGEQGGKERRCPGPHTGHASKEGGPSVQ